MHPKIAIVTVSYLNSSRRFKSAQASLKSLTDSVNEQYDLFVVDDIPRLGRGIIKSFLPDHNSIGLGKALYGQEDINLKRRYRKGSRSALVDAVEMAEHVGYRHVFIHLDDNVYLPILGELLSGAGDAMAKNRELKIVKLLGYPLLTHESDLTLGNRTFIEQWEGKVHFGQYQFSPIREEQYTLWQAKLSTSMCCAEFWPIGLWSAVYETAYLKKILTFGKAINYLHLVEVELVYRDSAAWDDFIGENPGSIGFINMQFCGFETEHNDNWPLLIQSPNEGIY